jgi:DNA-binding GntR family transcriptional regulator
MWSPEAIPTTSQETSRAVCAPIEPRLQADTTTTRREQIGFIGLGMMGAPSDNAIERFGEAPKALRARAQEQDQQGVLAAKTALYDVLLDNCGNTLVKELLTSLYSRVNLLQTTSLMHPDRLPASLREINDLYKKLKRRDADAAQAAARLHVANAELAAMRMLDQTAQAENE